jgi:hypothetical protein
MAALLNIQHVINQLFVVPVALGQVDLVGVYYEQRRGIVVKKELAVYLVELLKVLPVNETLGVNTPTLNAL